MKKNTFFSDNIKPTLVLMLIGSIIAALLSFTYNAAGIGEIGTGFTSAELDELMPEVLPNGSRLVPVKIALDDPDVLGIYKDDGEQGVAIHVQTKGYGGPLKLLVGFDKSGAVAGAKVVESQETPQLGSRATDPKFIAKFVGKSGIFRLSKDGGEIDAVAGATISSLAVTTAINKAAEVYDAKKGEIS